MILFEYLWLLSGYFFNATQIVLQKTNSVIVARIIEGIAIGMYANIVGQAVDDEGVSYKLILKSIMAIIFTIISTKIQNQRKDF